MCVRLVSLRLYGILISNHGVHFNPIYLDLMMVDRGFGDLNLFFKQLLGINCKLTQNSVHCVLKC